MVAVVIVAEGVLAGTAVAGAEVMAGAVAGAGVATVVEETAAEFAAVDVFVAAVADGTAAADCGAAIEDDAIGCAALLAAYAAASAFAWVSVKLPDVPLMILMMLFRSSKENALVIDVVPANNVSAKRAMIAPFPTLLDKFFIPENYTFSVFGKHHKSGDCAISGKWACLVPIDLKL